MRPLKSFAICIVVGVFISSMLALPAEADSGWGQGQKGKPAENPHESVGPAYYGQPLTLDDTPWNEDRGKKKGPDFESSSPSAWWMQMAVDEFPWGEKPEPKGNPKPE